MTPFVEIGLRSQLQNHIYWYLGRSGGLVAYLITSLSVALGLVVSSRKAGSTVAPGWFYEVHKFLSILGLAVMVFHVLIMLPDPYARFQLQELLIPFASHIDPLGVALGIFALYASALLVVSFYAKRIIRQKGWRLIHWLSFGVFALATAHGLLAGTDASATPVLGLYVCAAAAIGLLIPIRFRLSRRRRASSVPGLPHRQPALGADTIPPPA